MLMSDDNHTEQQSEEKPADDSEQPAEQSDNQPAEDTDQSAEQSEEQTTDTDQSTEQVDEQPADTDQSAEQSDETPTGETDQSEKSAEPVEGAGGSVAEGELSAKRQSMLDLIDKWMPTSLNSPMIPDGETQDLMAKAGWTKATGQYNKKLKDEV